MAFQLDPVFHNKTMVKILLAQGHLLHAGKICQKLLSKDPENAELLDLYEKSKTTFQKNFAGNAFKTVSSLNEQEVEENVIESEVATIEEIEESEISQDEMPRVETSSEKVFQEQTPEFAIDILHSVEQEVQEMQLKSPFEDDETEPGILKSKFEEMSREAEANKAKLEALNHLLNKIQERRQ